MYNSFLTCATLVWQHQTKQTGVVDPYVMTLKRIWKPFDSRPVERAGKEKSFALQRKRNSWKPKKVNKVNIQNGAVYRWIQKLIWEDDNMIVLRWQKSTNATSITCTTAEASAACW